MTNDEIFQGLASLPRWVPYKLIFDPKREKWDKIPHNGRHGISTTDSTAWRELLEAAETSKNHGLSGLGFVMTGGIEFAGWTLLGFDFDHVDFDQFKLPFKTYSERSPSKTGVRAFAWVPTPWANRFQDTYNAKPPHCEHAEIYMGTAARFLTLTWDTIDAEPIAQLQGKDLLTIEAWGIHDYEVSKPTSVAMIENAGTPLNFKQFKLTSDQKTLVEGTGKLDRSQVIHGLIINLIDSGAPQDDILATIIGTPTLWQYCCDHRNHDSERALIFAREEIIKAFSKSKTGMRESLIGYNDRWKIAEPVTKKDDLLFPLELYHEAPGLVGEVARWIMQASYAPREEFAYASALSMVSCLIGPYCTHGSRNSKMNLYLTMVGSTGTGKNEAIDVMCLLLNETEAKDCVLDFPASEAALRRQLNVTPNVLLRIDELAHKLQAMEKDGSSMGRAILEAYNGARMPMKVYADSHKSLPAVENPFVQILGGTTDKVWEVVKTSHMEDGTLNRFIFVCLSENPCYRRNMEPNGDVPKDFKDKLNLFWRSGRMNDLLGDVELPGFGRKVTYDTDVKLASEQLDRQVWDLQQRDNGSLYSRFVMNALKIASILAVGDGRMLVSMQDFEHAQKFMKWSVMNTANKIGVHMSNTNFERVSKRLLAKLDKDGGTLGMREAYRFLHITRREMEELIATLILSGQIGIDSDDEKAPNGAIIEWIVKV